MDYKYPLAETYTINTIRELMERATSIGGEKIAFQEKISDKTKYTGYTFTEINEKIHGFIASLRKKCISKNDKIAIISENRIAWAITYLSATVGGAIIVPIDKESKEQELFHILHSSEAKVVVFTSKHNDIIEDISNKLPNLTVLINIDLDEHRDNVYSFQKLIDEGIDIVKEKGIKYFKENLNKDDTASLLYTSGTTAMPKIVPLSHLNICSNIMAMIALIGIRHDDHFLSVLPMHHVYECTCGFLCPYSSGCTVSFVPNLRRVAENLAETQASVMLGVPILFKSMYKRLISKLTDKLPTKIYYHSASILSAITKKKLSKKVFAPLHKKLGGRLRLFITGGSAMDPYVSEGLLKLGFNIIQGYGLTECSPILAVNRPKFFKNEAAGFIMPSCEVKIYNPNENMIGEIIAKGNSVMKGYYRNDQLNKEAFVDGWFRTGDMGYFDKDGLLHVVGRFKNIIVTDGGKNVYPEELEEHLNRSGFILESMVTTKTDAKTGQERIFAIIVPDYEMFDTYCKLNNIENNERTLYDIIDKEIKKVSDGLADYKRILGFSIRSEEFQKTSTKKIKRHVVS